MWQILWLGNTKGINDRSVGRWGYGGEGWEDELEFSFDQIYIFVARKTLGCTYVPLFIYQGI